MSGVPTTQSEGQRPPLQPAQRVQLTREELRVLRECNHESFWYRCVPLGLFLSAGTQFLVVRGVLKPHPRYGASLKHFGALLAGYILGKFSYQSECRKKIMQLENSPLAEAMRRGQMGGTFMPDMAAAIGSVGDVEPEDPSKLRDEYTSRDIDNRTIQLKGLDEYQRPSLDRETAPSSNTQESVNRNYTSYEELRLQNRAEYDRKAAVSQPAPSTQQPSGPAGSPPAQQPPQGTSTPSLAWDTAPSGSRGVRRNKYGDIIEETD